MKKIKKFFRFCLISLLLLAVFLPISNILFRLIWNFELLNPKSYSMIADYWEKGGVFNTAKDYSLGFSMLFLPIIWLICSYKLYKYGLLKFLLVPITKIYRYATRPESMDVEHVSIKHLGEKERTIDEIIADRIKAENKDSTGPQAQTVKDLRQQISTKLGENENQ